jgi:redox-sensitive bicupin YhaK (pirin superfamily)
LLINQDASMSRLVLSKDENITLNTEQRMGYMHIIQGQLNVNGEQFSAGDGFAIEPEQSLEIKADADLEALWFDLPMS